MKKKSLYPLFLLAFAKNPEIGRASRGAEEALIKINTSKKYSGRNGSYPLKTSI